VLLLVLWMEEERWMASLVVMLEQRPVLVLVVL
jgi:hypothetical protein